MNHGDCRSYCPECELDELKERNRMLWRQLLESAETPKPEPEKPKEPPGESYWPRHASI